MNFNLSPKKLFLGVTTKKAQLQNKQDPTLLFVLMSTIGLFVPQKAWGADHLQMIQARPATRLEEELVKTMTLENQKTETFLRYVDARLSREEDKLKIAMARAENDIRIRLEQHRADMVARNTKLIQQQEEHEMRLKVQKEEIERKQKEFEEASKKSKKRSFFSFLKSFGSPSERGSSELDYSYPAEEMPLMQSGYFLL